MLGNLVARTEYSPQAIQTDAEFYVNEGGSWLLKFDASGQVQEHYLHAPSVDALLALDDINYSPQGDVVGQLLWALTDHQGTVRDIARTGQPAVHLTYDPFGRPHGIFSNQNLPIDVFFSRYMGMPWDEETGLYLDGARAYDPVGGRYLSPGAEGIGGGAKPLCVRGQHAAQSPGARITVAVQRHRL